MADYDGDLTNVNPELLKLCANSEDWREQRRRAMKAKIFGSAASTGSASASAGAYLPPENSSSGPSPASSAPAAPAASQQATEAYILQQILSHKRRRDEANGQPQPPSQPTPPPEAPSGEQGLSLKEKLMRKYRKD